MRRSGATSRLCCDDGSSSRDVALRALLLTLLILPPHRSKKAGSRGVGSGSGSDSSPRSCSRSTSGNISRTGSGCGRAVAVVAAAAVIGGGGGAGGVVAVAAVVFNPRSTHPKLTRQPASSRCWFPDSLWRPEGRTRGIVGPRSRALDLLGHLPRVLSEIARVEDRCTIPAPGRKPVLQLTAIVAR